MNNVGDWGLNDGLTTWNGLTFYRDRVVIMGQKKKVKFN